MNKKIDKYIHNKFKNIKENIIKPIVIKSYLAAR
jgi:hypothetical protein